MAKSKTKAKTATQKGSKKENKKQREKKKELVVREASSAGFPAATMRDLDNAFDEFRRDIVRSLGWPLLRRHSLFNWPENYWPKLEWVRMRKPLVDIRDNGKEIIVDVEMPGIPKENIDIQVSANSIEICGELHSENEMEEEGYLRRERSFSTCYRQMPLPTEVIPDGVDAIYEDGMLRVRLPKKDPSPSEKPRKIKIK